MIQNRRRLSRIMTRKHPQWNVFRMLLDMKLNYKEDKEGKASWNCDCTLSGTREILEFMAMDIEKSIKYMESNGGYCDCEVMMNVVQEAMSVVQED